MQKPAPPQPLSVEGKTDSPFNRWLTLFYEWVTSQIADILSIFSTVDFVVGTASSSLGAERVGTDTTSIDVDIGTAGQMKWNLIDEYAQDLVGAMLTDSSSIDFTYTDVSGTLTAAIIDEYVQDLVGALIIDSSEIDFTYNDGAATLTAALIITGVTAASYGSASAVATFTVDSKGRLTAAANATISITASQVSDFSEAAQDVVGALVIDSTTINFTYNDGANTLTGITIQQMSITADASGLLLDGDEASPGNSKVYGTDSGGTKGWQDAPSSDGITKAIALSTHGFSVGNIVYYTGSTWAKADADAVSTAEVVGIVKTVPDTDNFVLQTGGWLDGLSGLTAGVVYFLSGTAGALTATEPSTPGQVSKPLLIADTTTSGYFFNWRGQVVGSNSGSLAVDRFSGDGADTTFDLSAAPNSENETFVFISGVYQQKDTYSLSSTTITFSTAPPSGTNNIEVVRFGSVDIGTASALSGGLYDVLHVTPGGRITLTSATPVLTSDVSNATTVYYTPYLHNVIPIYDGTNWKNYEFTELSNVLANSSTGNAGPAAGAADQNYDLFVWNNGGTITLTRGPVWTDSTTRSAGTTLVRTDGVWTNNAAITNGPAATKGTYVGTIRTDASGAQVDWELGGTAAGGDPGFLYVWNMYNRVLVSTVTRDSTDSWTYAPGAAAIRSSNNSTSNRCSFVRGLNEDAMIASSQLQALSDGTTRAGAAIGLDSTSAVSAFSSIGATGTTVSYLPMTSAFAGRPGLGLHFLQMLEVADNTTTASFRGDNGDATFQQGHFLGVMGLF